MFVEDRNTEEWYTPEINRQIWVRIRLAVAAYAYEVENNPIISDSEFDDLAKEVDLSIDTRRVDMDEWFRENFLPHTGQWVWKHPEQGKLAYLVELWRNKSV